EMSLVSYARLNSLFTLKSEQVVDITDLIAPLSLKTSLVSGDVVPIPSFESLSRDSVTSNAY
ncbi:MAG: hypothetical protein ACE5FU_12480, partial [Nitrospinota bacterium]